MKNFTERLGITGHLTIIKKHKNGKEEILLDDHNVIVSGMGVGLSYLFTASGSDTITDYQIDRFQLGASGNTALEVSTTSYLSGALGPLQYGEDSNLYIKQNTQINGPNDVLLRTFAMIPANKITKIGDASVRYTLVVDEEACNNLVGQHDEDEYLREIGLFMGNPRGSVVDASILVAYRAFSEIRKTSDFSLIFRWTLNF
jgi:hypothetical protein